MDYPWPGNVRELENRMKRAVILAQSPVLYPEDLFGDKQDLGAPEPHREIAVPFLGPGGKMLPFKEAKEAFERDYLTQLLTRSRGNVSAAARVAGRYRADLYHLLRKHGVEPADFKWRMGVTVCLGFRSTSAQSRRVISGAGCVVP